MSTQSRSIYGTTEKEVNYERSHTLIAQQKTEAEKLLYYRGQTSSANAMFSKIKEETAILKAQALEATADRTAKLKTEEEMQAYYKAQTKTAEATTLKVEAETKILVEQADKVVSQGHLYNAGTTLACLGCITGLLALGLYGYKAVKELRG